MRPKRDWGKVLRLSWAFIIIGYWLMLVLTIEGSPVYRLFTLILAGIVALVFISDCLEDVIELVKKPWKEKNK